jgi:methionyl-tRNA formyltransferase
VTQPYPGAFTTCRNERLLVWWARTFEEPVAAGAPGEVLEVRPGHGVVVATGGGALLLERVQLDGDDVRRADELARSIGLTPGERLGAAEQNTEESR